MKKLWLFFYDILRYRANSRHVIHLSSFYIMRRLDIYTLGYTTSLLKYILAPRKMRASDPVSVSLQHQGYAKLENFSGAHLQVLTDMEVFCRAKPELRGHIDEVESKSREILGRLDIDETAILKSKTLATFITQSPFLEIAKRHYGRDVACVRANAWWSIPTTSSKAQDGAAQKFHRDIDWLGELKFFTFAMDVKEENGPFEFIKETHRKRLDRYIMRDGRIEEEEMFRSYPRDKHLVSTVCNAGDTYVVDTRGYHRGQPVKVGRRCVLCIEFSQNTFGAEAQYRPRAKLDPSWESYDVWSKAIAEQPAWATLFDSATV